MSQEPHYHRVVLKLSGESFSKQGERGISMEEVLHIANQVKQASFRTMRRRAAEHEIEVVGEKLRAMMPWISQNALVDKAKN